MLVILTKTALISLHSKVNQGLIGCFIDNENFKSLVGSFYSKWTLKIFQKRTMMLNTRFCTKGCVIFNVGIDIYRSKQQTFCCSLRVEKQQLAPLPSNCQTKTSIWWTAVRTHIWWFGILNNIVQRIYMLQNFSKDPNAWHKW
jgi:hypothetical protein